MFQKRLKVSNNPGSRRSGQGTGRVRLWGLSENPGDIPLYDGHNILARQYLILGRRMIRLTLPSAYVPVLKHSGRSSKGTSDV